jgi:hypothetical protein
LIWSNPILMLEIHYPSVALANYIYMHRISTSSILFPRDFEINILEKKGRQVVSCKASCWD